MRYETPTFQVVGDARQLVLGKLPNGDTDRPDEPSTPFSLLLGLD